MEGHIERLTPRLRILPSHSGGQRQGGQTPPQFSLFDEESIEGRAPTRESECVSPDLALDEDRPIGHAADDESGSHLDLTA